MAVSVFDDKQIVPDDAMLAEALDGSKVFYDLMVSHIDSEYGLSAREWKFYGKKSGWTQKMLSGKRNILFLIPGDGSFRLGFVFGERAFEKIMESSVPQHLKDELNSAVKYAEGRGLQVEVKDGDDLKNVFELIKIKMEN